MPKISELAMVCRSKNAGPFLLTLDVVFRDEETFEKVRKTGVINPMLFSKLYGVPESTVQFTEYGPGHAFKATIPRLVGSGDIEDTDVYGAQQHAPLLDVDIPI